MRRLLALLLLCPAPLVAQTADSVVCRACVPDSVHVDSTLVRVDTTITYTYRITYDTTFRDSVVPVSQPPQPPQPPPPVSGHSPYARGVIRPFNSKTEAGWIDRGDAAFTLVADPRAPSPPTVGQAAYPTGMRGGTGSIA